MAQQRKKHRITAAQRRRARRRRGCARLLLLLAGFLGVVMLSFRFFTGVLEGTLRPAQAAKDVLPVVKYTGTAPFAVAVDAGHGGGDTGAIGLVTECDMTAEIAGQLMALLEADPNFTPVSTRETYQTHATPVERAAAANAAGAQLLLSIHGNAGDENASGFECYPPPPGLAQHRAGMELARALTEEFSAAGQSLRGVDGVRYVYYVGGQKTFAESTDKTVRTEGTFTLLEECGRPAVLAEVCFVTNARDVAAFGKGDGCAAAARCCYRAICTYFDVEPMNLTGME